MRGYNYKTGKIPHCTRSSGMNFIQNLFPPGRKILQPTWPDTLVSNPTPIQSIFFPSRGDIVFVITSPYHDNIKTLSKDGKVVSVSAVSVIVTSVFIIAQRCVSCTRIRQQTMQVFGWLVGWLVGWFVLLVSQLLHYPPECNSFNLKSRGYVLLKHRNQLVSRHAKNTIRRSCEQHPHWKPQKMYYFSLFSIEIIHRVCCHFLNPCSKYQGGTFH